MSVCTWCYSPLREGGPPNTVQPSSPLRGVVWRAWHSSIALITAPPVDEAPPTEVGVVAGGACAARELLGGTQPFPFSWTHLFLLLFLGSGADNGSQAPPREGAQ